MTLLRTDALSVVTGTRTLIDQLDWTVEAGQLWCVLGRNGAGKSSLLHVLSGLSSPAHGTVLVDGMDIAKVDPLSLARSRGLMMQQVVDSFSCTVFDAVAIGRTPLRIGRSWDDADDAAAIQHALRRVGMSDRSGDDVMRLSGGERQRVALAALLAQQVPLMLLDEPTSHQDVAHQLSVMQLLRELALAPDSPRAVIATCHDINLAMRFATHLLVLGDGEHWTGQPGEAADAIARAFGCVFEKRPGLFVVNQ